jgi:Mg2+ and Co2+ transporter CorA
LIKIRVYREGEELTTAPHARPHEVDLVSGRNFLLSFHRGRPVDAEAIAARVRAHPDLVDEGGGFLLYVVLDELVDAFFPALDRIGERVEDLQEAVFQGRTQVQADLFLLRKDMVKVRRVAGPMRDAMVLLLRRDTGLYTEEARRYLQDIYDHRSGWWRAWRTTRTWPRRRSTPTSRWSPTRSPRWPGRLGPMPPSSR